MSVPVQPCINPNPDIAGIGVRVSVYMDIRLRKCCSHHDIREPIPRWMRSPCLCVHTSGYFSIQCISRPRRAQLQLDQ